MTSLPGESLLQAPTPRLHISRCSTVLTAWPKHVSCKADENGIGSSDLMLDAAWQVSAFDSSDTPGHSRIVASSCLSAQEHP